MRYKILSPTIVVALVAISSSALAQGTASGPFTIHDLEPGLIVNIGDATSPIPIDLDPTGAPWFKSLMDTTSLSGGGGTINVFETIENVGTEAWGDWHEHIIGDPASASAPSFWSSVMSMGVNGSPITFTAAGVGTKDLWLDNFSMPVLPGDILTIHKTIDVFSNTAGGDGFPLVRMQEYPTPHLVPEPSSALLFLSAIAATSLIASRRSAIR